MEYYFDPSETVRGIQQLLVSDKKKIGFLFGAGTSLSVKNGNSPTIPAIDEMTSKVVEAIIMNSGYSVALDDIRKEILDYGNIFTVENLLSNITEKIAVIGRGTLNKLDRNGLIDLNELIKNEIRKIKQSGSDLHI